MTSDGDENDSEQEEEFSHYYTVQLNIMENIESLDEFYNQVGTVNKEKTTFKGYPALKAEDILSDENIKVTAYYFYHNNKISTIHYGGVIDLYNINLANLLFNSFEF